MSRFEIEAVGTVIAKRDVAEDDYWGDEHSRIELSDQFIADALAGLEAFSHVEVLFLFDRVSKDKIVTGARHPRNNQD
ncbi:MAG: tRNA (Thr-GGU) A37 N-methylase [Planctomycetaceae bacterium]|jgi:tRNA (Thr-GGU) A37 N-methylase